MPRWFDTQQLSKGTTVIPHIYGLSSTNFQAGLQIM
jgi:hypothetical protein